MRDYKERSKMKRVLIGGCLLFFFGFPIASDLAGRFYPGGSLEILEGTEPENESGVKNGVFYRFHFSDYSGIFGGYPEYAGSIDPQKPSYDWLWRVSCTNGSMTDGRMCLLMRGAISVAVRNNDVLISVLGNKFPGKETTLRVDRDEAVRTSADFFAGAQADLIVKEMREGGYLTVRYYQWPYNWLVVNKISLFGFSEAMDYILWAVKQK